MGKNKGFTLVELVVVVMILGILAAVAAPKMMGTSAKATDNGVRQTLAVVRDAIERYAAEHGGTLPGTAPATEAQFKLDLKTYLRGEFPKCPVALQNDAVLLKTTAGDVAATNATGSWHYSNQNGQFIVNSDAQTKSDPAVTYDEL